MKLYMMPGTIMCLVLSCPPVAGARGESTHPQLSSYDLEVGFFPEARMDFAGLIEVLKGERPSWNKEDSIKNYPHMRGKAVMEVDLGELACSSLDFYLHGELRVHEVTLGSKKLQFSQEPVFYRRSYSGIANKIAVQLKGLKGVHRFVFVYGGVFNPSVARFASNYMRIDGEGAYLRGRDSMWFPVLLTSDDDSHPVDFKRVRVETDRKFRAVFTGRRLSETVMGGKRVSQWRAEQIGFGEAQMTVRPFRVAESKGIFLYHLDHPASMKAAEDIRKFVEQLLAYFADHFKQADTTSQTHVAELPNFASGISSGNMIGFTSGQWRRFSSTDGDTYMEELVSHELVHSFVSPKVGQNSQLAALFVEGFPSYFHLHILAEMVGEAWYQEYMQRIENSYLEKRETGKTHRGRLLPPEKPILSISFDEIGTYKDKSVLSDRVRLFLNYLRTKMGKQTFKQFTRQVCTSTHLTPRDFSDVIGVYLPGSGDDTRIWLETNDFPKRFRLNQ